MLGNLNYAVKNGADAYAISTPDMDISNEIGKVTFIPVQFAWGNASPFKVIKNILELYRIFKKEKIDIIQYATSNAGLYASVAGFLAHVPIRVYCQWGISYGDYSGLKFKFYKFAEWLTCKLSTSVQPDSYANLNYAISEKLYPRQKGEVIYNGSATGVDLNKYNFDKRESWRQEIRSKFNIPENAFVFGFVGRLAIEKGINELLEAFNGLDTKGQDVYLMLVGPEYNSALLNQQHLKQAQNNPKIIFVGSVPSAERYFASFDMLVLPSYREGFGMVVIEAAAVGTPTLVSRIKGPTDFVKDGSNGVIFEVKSAASLRQKMTEIISMPTSTFSNLGANAYKDASEKFSMEIFKDKWWSNRQGLWLGKQK